ncbi:MAG: glycosyltransferase family 87 protein [Planctomycetota bacterium]
MLVLTMIAPSFGHIMDTSGHPLGLFVGLMIVGGLIHLIAIKTGARITSRRALAWLVFVGLAMRLITVFSDPILEEDYHRYLWDGSVVASGNNPYTHAPSAVIDSVTDPDTRVSGSLRQLTEDPDARRHLQLINHAQIRTIYPPVTQLTFGLTHVIQPWSLEAWRGVMLVFDLAALGLIFLLLKFTGRPLGWALVYWWCPLAVKEIFNSGHMDALVFPFVLGAVWLAVRGHSIGATATAILGAGVKLWPLMLAPLLARHDLNKPRRVFAHGAVSVVLVAPMAWWVISGRLGGDSAFVIYAKSWANNSLLYTCQVWLCERVFGVMGWGDRFLHLPPRVLGVVIMLGVLAWATRHRWKDAGELIDRHLWLIGVLLLVSPTQFPWYYVWVLPLLSLRLYWPALLYTVTLPLYYYSYQHPWVIWIEHAPPLIWMACDLGRSIRTSQRKASLRDVS